MGLLYSHSGIAKKYPIFPAEVRIGLGFLKVKTTATQKRLCGKRMSMVGAVGFEPTTSTV